MRAGLGVPGLSGYRVGVGAMRVLVTGGTGFVGAHSVAALMSQGHQIRLLVRSRPPVTVPDTAPLLDRLIGLTGRDPA
jgi:uncharacterized protein YbjT (DUF2867 family)